MENPPKVSGVAVEGFFERCKLPATARDDCNAFARSKYSGPIRPAPFQGYCSYTLFVAEDVVVQFRPSAHRLDPGTTAEACEIFGHLAPETKCLGEVDKTGLHVFSMTKLPGISLADLRTQPCGPLQRNAQRKQAVRDFARLQVASWRRRVGAEDIRRRGTVGSSLKWRLDLMADTLPPRFRGIARSVLADLPDIEALPWTLSHGDFLPSNIQVFPKSGQISGLLDWAEAEWLPFGVGMYGLEELLGQDTDDHFVDYPEAQRLRNLFWRELTRALPQLAQDARTLATIRKAQTLGILLWHGIAFDDGKLNRAVAEGQDDREIDRLDAFLLSAPSLQSWGLVQVLFSFIRGPRKQLRSNPFWKVVAGRLT
ncbi:hypothetical protein GGR56DRAFT_262098 [Xylariaceae sp. FL0804]|nr:hypothetical protein GGR56DRAFT_262098 [Xylariaceae sp. FL0804]